MRPIWRIEWCCWSCIERIVKSNYSFFKTDLDSYLMEHKIKIGCFFLSGFLHPTTNIWPMSRGQSHCFIVNCAFCILFLIWRLLNTLWWYWVPRNSAAPTVIWTSNPLAVVHLTQMVAPWADKTIIVAVVPCLVPSFNPGGINFFWGVKRIFGTSYDFTKKFIEILQELVLHSFFSFLQCKLNEAAFTGRVSN